MKAISLLAAALALAPFAARAAETNPHFPALPGGAGGASPAYSAAVLAGTWTTSSGCRSSPRTSRTTRPSTRSTGVGFKGPLPARAYLGVGGGKFEVMGIAVKRTV